MLGVGGTGAHPPPRLSHPALPPGARQALLHPDGKGLCQASATNINLLSQRKPGQAKQGNGTSRAPSWAPQGRRKKLRGCSFLLVLAAGGLVSSLKEETAVTAKSLPQGEDEPPLFTQHQSWVLLALLKASTPHLCMDREELLPSKGSAHFCTPRPKRGWG